MNLILKTYQTALVRYNAEIPSNTELISKFGWVIFRFVLMLISLLCVLYGIYASTHHDGVTRTIHSRQHSL